jgi:hypothetical protein
VKQLAVFALATAAATTTTGAVAAEAPFATLNNLPARALPDSTRAAELGVRMFASDDVAYSGSVRAGLRDGWQVALTLNAFRADNDDTLGADQVESTWRGGELSAFKSLSLSERSSIGLQVAVEIRDSKARVKTTGVFTKDDDSLWSLALPASLKVNDKLDLEATLKGVFFNKHLRSSAGNSVEGYGDVVALTLGGRFALSPAISLGADITPILSGDNSIDDNSGQVDDTQVWSLSARYAISAALAAEVFATNGSGTSMATSVIGSSGDDVFGGVRLSISF